MLELPPSFQEIGERSVCVSPDFFPSFVLIACMAFPDTTG